MKQKDLFLFMDANIYLKFYSFSDDDLDIFAKFYGKSIEKCYRIITTDLLKNEFERRKEVRFNETLEQKVEINIDIKDLVLLADDEGDFQELKELEKELRAAIKKYKIKYGDILNKLKLKYLEGKLLPDELINRIFHQALNVSLNPTIIEKAKLRLALNNPPGKVNQLGDRIHWESLLEIVNEGNDLIIISNDSDFYSRVEPTKINPFLLQEWKSKKQSSIEAFRTVNQFFKCYLPQFELKDELAAEISEKIELLTDSNSFSQTHFAISQLNALNQNFTRNHIKAIISAYKNNSQIYGILCDADVRDFLTSLKVHPNYDVSLDIDIDIDSLLQRN